MSRAFKLSLGVTQGKVAEYHSRRSYTPPSAEPSLAERNVHVIDPRNDDGSLVTYREQVNEIFAGAIDRYNERQTRKRLKKSHDYYEEIDGSKRKEKPVYSTLIQIGNHTTNGVTDVLFDEKKWKKLKETDPKAAAEYVAEHLDDRPQTVAAKEALIDICERFSEWYPQLEVVSIVIHDDEPAGTCHADINWCPVAGGEGSGVYKGGLDTRCALNKALAQMGFDGRGYDFAIKHWQADVKEKCEEVMLEHGIEREYQNNAEKHKDIATYKIEREREEEAAKLAEIKRRQEVARVIEEETMARIDELKVQEADINARVQRANMEEVSVMSRVKTLQDREAELDEQIRRKERAYSNAEDKLDDAEYRAQRAEQRAERAEQRADDAEDRLEEFKKKLEEVRETYRRQRREADELDDELREKKKEKEQYEEAVRKAKKVAESCKDEVDRAKKQRDAWYRELERVSQLVDQFKRILMAFVDWVNDKRTRGEINMSARTWMDMRHAVDDYGASFQEECEELFAQERVNAKREPEDVVRRDVQPIKASGGNIPASQNRSIDLSLL